MAGADRRDRGGFYSYDWLERAVGAHIHNTQIVHPEWQELSVGDSVWLARRYGQRARQVVADIEPKSHLVLMSEPDFDRMARVEKASGAWGFYVRQDDGPSRLLARGSGGAVGHVTFDVPHFVMEQQVLRHPSTRGAGGNYSKEVQDRVEQIVEGRDRLDGLIEAMLVVTSGLDLAATLRSIVHTPLTW